MAVLTVGLSTEFDGFFHLLEKEKVCKGLNDQVSYLVILVQSKKIHLNVLINQNSYVRVKHLI